MSWGSSELGSGVGSWRVGARPVSGTNELLLQAFDGPLQLGRARFDAPDRVADAGVLVPYRTPSRQVAERRPLVPSAGLTPTPPVNADRPA